MSSVFSLPPILFVTLREMYDISYTLLGTLVLVNFCTQLGIDLIFTMFSKHFNIHKVVKSMPFITSAGLLIFALTPMLFPSLAYPGLLLGTVIFSVSAGFSEVLLSPTIAAIPSDNPQKDMGMLHSLYAFGFFTVVVVSTFFLKIFGNENWMYLTIFWAILPIIAAVMFMLSPMPNMESGAGAENAKKTGKRGLGLAICVGSIFFGSCSECAMSAWISGFMENALHIDKAIGDVLGMAMFAILLGIARVLYAKFGKNIIKTLLVGMAGCAVCYITVGISSNSAVVFLACVLIGIFSAMLWPGTLIMMEENIPGVGVAAYALMAAGGDLGASVAPQLVGIVIDRVAASDFAARMSFATGLMTEQIGMKAGMLVNAAFPVAGTILLLWAMWYFKEQKKSASQL